MKRTEPCFPFISCPPWLTDIWIERSRKTRTQNCFPPKKYQNRYFDSNGFYMATTKMPKSKIWILSSPPRPRVGTSHRLRASQRYTIMRKLIGKPETYYKWHYCYLKRAVYHSNFQAYNDTVLTNVLCWFWLDADKRKKKCYFLED